jgi:hypothetical protein
MRPRQLLAILALALPLATSCNRYPLFMLSGYKQETFNNKADILFIVDNSPSMYDNSADLALNFNSFIDRLVDPNTGSGVRTDTLSDAVSNFVNYVSDTSRYLDYQLALTTTSKLAGSHIDAGEPWPGYNGKIAGDVPFISEATTSDLASAFKHTLLCDLTAWPAYCGGGIEENCIPYDPNYQCGDPANVITYEYLACVCGKDWVRPDSGSGSEMGLLSAFVALCRASPELLAEDPVLAEACTKNLEGSDFDSNEGFLREDSSVIVVIVTDEGDYSESFTYMGDEGESISLFRPADSDMSGFLDLLDRFDRRIAFAVVGPYYQNGQTICNTASIQTWSAQRYMNAAADTSGFYNFIVQPAADYGTTGSCEYPRFSQHLERLGDLMNTMLNVFPLQSVPKPETILVFVDDAFVEEAQCEENCDAPSDAQAQDRPVFSSGWIYDSSQNAVIFTGEATPAYNAEVRIYYHPLGELPRPLPF